MAAGSGNVPQTGGLPLRVRPRGGQFVLDEQRRQGVQDDAVAVMDAVGWDRAHVFGHPMGGPVAQRTAIRHPHRVLSLTTSSAVPSDAASGPVVLRYVRPATLVRLARLRHPRTPEGNVAPALDIARILAATGQQVSEHEVRDFVAQEAAHQVDGFRDQQTQSRQIGARWHGGTLARIAAPTSVLHGEQDPLLRMTAAHDIAAAVPGARLTPLPGLGHFLTRNAWAAYATEVRAPAAGDGSRRVAG